MWSHGHDLFSARTATPPHWDIQSLAVLCTFPLLLVLVLTNHKRGR
jgi:hypothetical protein